MLLRLVLFLFLTSLLTMATETSPEIAQMAESNAKFTKSFYEILRTTPGNLFFSPLSIEAVLALAHAGAGGETAAQIQKGAHLPETREASAKLFGQLMDLIAGDDSIVLNIANGLYTSKASGVKQDYLDIVKNGFKAELGLVDFNDSVTATNEINAWVAKKTNNKIPELFAQGILNSLTRVVLLNALYFKGNWDKQFPASDTKKGVFHLNEKDTKDVDFMTLKANFRIRAEDDAHIVELPYKGKSVSMILVVPKEVNGLAAIEERLADADLTQLLKEGRSREVVLKMPKFKLETTLELNEILEKLGMKDMFSDSKANFKGISEEPLFVSKAIQKAFIEVNEEGSEAAAATVLKVRMKRSLMDTEPLEILADRPFLFFVKSSGITLFVGAYRLPTGSSSPSLHTEL